MMKAAFCVLLVLSVALGDVYMHVPRGSNDRNREANTNRNNGNRLFDSQNNAKGGYCWGPSMYYYEGSLLQIEWTAQHSCNAGKLFCNIVIQYMCGRNDAPLDARIRDGTTTDTITATEAGAQNTAQGMHEPLAHYLACQARSANYGLYVADRVGNGLAASPNRRAVNTRQSNGGTQNGLECPEERDYYPYWHPSPWKDIAVLTDDITMCKYYQTESANVKVRGYCSPTPSLPNNPADCTAAGLTWVEVPANGDPDVDCVQAPFSKDNSLGNTLTGYNSGYNWTIPTGYNHNCTDDDTCLCVLRIRYNVSSVEIPFFTDASSNAANSPLHQDPTVNISSDTTDNSNTFTLAVDTTQFARTFQDRSHTWRLKIRPDGVLGTARIYNLNVKGKRGNIVQAYPAVEYAFSPEFIDGRVGDYIHFQWTGCDTNPAGNAGEGTDQTDRSNAVQIPLSSSVLPCTDAQLSSGGACYPPLFTDPADRALHANIGQTGCLSQTQLNAAATAAGTNEDQLAANCFKLNGNNNNNPEMANSGYFDGGLTKLNNTGEFYYMSTRNNNFSNRGQKGQIQVTPLLPTWAVTLLVISGVTTAAAAGVGGAMFYAKANPHSMIADKLAMFEKN